MKPGAWVTAKRLAGVVTGVIAYLPLLVVTAVSGQAMLSAGQLAAMSAVLIAGTMGTLASGTAAPAYVNLLYRPGLYLSGVFFPLPKSMYFQAPFWPQLHLNQLVFAAGGVDKFRWIAPEMAFALLLGFTVLCGGIAWRRLSRRG